MTTQTIQRTGAVQLKKNVSHLNSGIKNRKICQRTAATGNSVVSCRMCLVISLCLFGTSFDYSRSAETCHAAERENDSRAKSQAGTSSTVSAATGESSPQVVRHKQIILLDDGLSMFARAGEQSAYEQALEGLEQRLRNNNADDDNRDVILARMSEVNEDKLRELLSSTKKLKDITPLLKHYREAGPSWVDTNVEQALTTCRTMIHKLKGTSLVILSNFSSDGWNSAFELIDQLSAELSSVELVSCAQGTTDNISITGLETRWKRNANTAQIEVQFAVRNESTSELDNVIVTIGCDGIDVEHKLLRLRAGETATGVVGIERVNPRSPHWISVRIPQDSFMPDNVRYSVVVPTRRQRMLMVDDSSNALDGSDALEVVLKTLANREQNGGDVTGANFILESCSLADLQPSRLKSTDILCLNNVRLSETQFSIVEEYVSQGGCLLFVMGDRVDLEMLSTHGFNKGRGWFPLKPVRLNIVDNTAPSRVRVIDDELGGHFSAINRLLESVVVQRYLETSRDPDCGQTIVYLQSSTGAPLLASKPYHSGDVLAMMTAGHLDWTNWPWNPSWPIFWDQVVSLCDARSQERFHATVGEALRSSCGRDVRELTYQRSYYDDDDDSETVIVEGALSIEIDKDQPSVAPKIQTNRSGIYEISSWGAARNNKLEMHAVNIADSRNRNTPVSIAQLLAMVPRSQVLTVNEWRDKSKLGDNQTSMASLKRLPPCYVRILKADPSEKSIEISVLSNTETSHEMPDAEEKTNGMSSMRIQIVNEMIETLSLENIEIAQARSVNGTTQLERVPTDSVWELLKPGQGMILIDQEAVSALGYSQLQLGKLLDNSIIIVNLINKNTDNVHGDSQSH